MPKVIKQKFPKISLQEPLKTIKQQKGQGNVKNLKNLKSED
jgi:hypothetical protein